MYLNPRHCGSVLCMVSSRIYIINNGWVRKGLCTLAPLRWSLEIRTTILARERRTWMLLLHSFPSTAEEARIKGSGIWDCPSMAVVRIPILWFISPDGSLHKFRPFQEQHFRPTTCPTSGGRLSCPRTFFMSSTALSVQLECQDGIRSRKPDMGVPKNQGLQHRTKNSRALIVRDIPKKDPPMYGNSRMILEP